MRKRLAIDIDDVLVDYTLAFIEFCNATYGVSFTKEDFLEHDFEGIWGISREEMYLRHQAFDRAGGKHRKLPSPGAQEMIARLAKIHDLHVVTNRTKEVRYDTMWLLDRHFPNMFADIHFCSKGYRVVRPKNIVCKSLGAYILLDDHLANVERCASAGIHAYLFDQPWNRHELPLLPGAVIRVSGWEDHLMETLL